MSDKSKANWPEKMVVEGPVRNINPDPSGLPICTAVVGGIFIHGFIFDEVESKASQICALPRMVELLRRLADKDINLNKAELEARRICKDIGELSGKEA